MGQYHLTVNLDKKEFLDPHQLGDGLKLVEQSGYSPGGTNDALHLLLAVSNGRGGGDFADSEWVGRWGGDRIAVIGDYAENTDLPAEFEAEGIYGQCRDGAYRDITPNLIPALEAAYEVVYTGDGWRDRTHLWAIKGLTSTCAAPMFVAACTQAPAGEPAPLDCLETVIRAARGGYRISRKDVEAVERLLAGLRAACARAEEERG